MSISPEQLARSGSEDGAQAALFCWIAIHINDYPDLRWAFAVPNGGWRDPATANKLKATGVKRGVPDICLPIPRREFFSCFIELKRPMMGSRKKGVISSDQRIWIEKLREFGHFVGICYGWIEASECLKWYLEIKE